MRKQIQNGNWYTAGCNNFYHSYPKGRSFTEAEFLPTDPQVITSNRRWREEEFLIGEQLTAGVSQLAIRIDWVPNEKSCFRISLFR